MNVFHENNEIYGKQIVILPISSEFEKEEYEKKVSKATNVRFLNYPDSTNGLLTFQPLTEVRCLDMRGIKLTALPPEIGLLTNLEYLDIRDNCLDYLPPELSECLKLKTLLYSGNSLFYVSQIQALNNLRQTNQAEDCAPQFKWAVQNGQFSIISWNIIAQHEAKQSRFHSTPARYLAWEYRMEHILNIAQMLKPSLFCLQEIEEKSLHELTERMRTIGYGCVSSFGTRTRIPGAPHSGIATFFLTARLSVERTVTIQFSDLPANEQITKLQLLENDAIFQLSVVRLQGQSFYLIHTSLFPNHFDSKIIEAQINIILDRVKDLSVQKIICGSFGFEPNSKPFNLIKANDQFKCVNYTTPEFFTQWENDEMVISDYIFASSQMYPTGNLVTTTQEDAKSYHHFMPNNQWPSSHLPIGVLIDIKLSN
ncbi:Endonuclease/Exonuclease/phosphatase family protein [Trichomonas vaginalis G3]|uniref:Endonuclease/Exonuclease/phosphatase family protein n=1 Tax=Trichomonas vaginalis (strain ATCC PRA-98 / G3) TaxID=412133 RepID=A2DFF9_TRIV3|nr:poly(A)-specific ribonuclease protein [Trichomonas vaginalis G3]EAY20887.1 Endonuclease/Exonuclease/phosphatase family protein [Trichomonas vaginalis G3]KAI5521503.1 poly(A)-specific ribonuclease protein [Trichomonas vaginalis G3]|eukprot:XP_001581873.1 Endonuclease/Exonuclease/phosphatase family protein [Trichomonas vaginalis G3]